MAERVDRRVGLVDVARVADVALSTASNALNGRGRVAPATVERVREAALKLGYLPNPAARDLRSGGSKLLGMVLRMDLDAAGLYPHDHYYTQAMTACITTASHRGYALVMLPERQMHVVGELPLSAVIVSDTAVDDAALDYAYALGIPVSTDYRPHDSRPRITVDVDVAGAVCLVNDHLAASGAYQVGLLSMARTNTSFCREWESNHRLWCEENNHSHLMRRGSTTDPQARAAAARQLWEAGCDAVVGLPIGSGFSLVAAAAALGKRIPDDLLVAVIDEDPGLATTEPPFTAVSLDPLATSVRGINLVIDVVEGKVATPASLLIPAHLTVRTSTQR